MTMSIFPWQLSGLFEKKVRAGFDKDFHLKKQKCVWNEDKPWVWDYSVWTEKDHRESTHM